MLRFPMCHSIGCTFMPLERIIGSEGHLKLRVTAEDSAQKRLDKNHACVQPEPRCTMATTSNL